MSKKNCKKQAEREWMSKVVNNSELITEEEKFNFHTPSQEEIDDIRIKIYKPII